MEFQDDQTVEIKARCPDPEKTAALIRETGAGFAGSELQVDTFYHVPQGRLKLRRKTSGDLLIGYLRPDRNGPKHCLVNLYPSHDAGQLNKVLSDSLGVRVVVQKQREIYLLGNTRFHLDRVEGLGSFVEIEVLGRRGVDDPGDLKKTCEKYLGMLGIRPADLVERAYADLLEEAGSGR
ncbi:MAG: class IV adenylate cyclase [Candidatus Glassbacteria bacterium]|nr:class IV adenylate cyclase [Candidatus Glassbacteria bacterium]